MLHRICRLLILAQCGETLPGSCFFHHCPLHRSPGQAVLLLGQVVLGPPAEIAGWVLHVPPEAEKPARPFSPVEEEPCYCHSAGASGGLIKEDLWSCWKSSTSGVESQMRLSDWKGTTSRTSVARGHGAQEMGLLKHPCRPPVGRGEVAGSPPQPPATHWT